MILGVSRNHNKYVSACILVLAAAIPASSSAQESSNAFDVVSIRPSNPSHTGGGGVTAFGYRAVGISLWTVIMYAYYPHPSGYWRSGQLVSGPTWLMKDRYDITAKVDSATEVQWRSLTNAERRERVRPMLRKMLQERCQLALHSSTAESPIYGLVVTKHGPKLKESAPIPAIPAGAIAVPLANTGDGAGVVVPYLPGEKPEEHFFGTPMSSLAAYLSDFSDRPIEDKTGLKGKYDFVLPKREELPPSSGLMPADDIAPAVLFDISDLGLALKPMKGTTDVLVIDRIERPLAN